MANRPELIDRIDQRFALIDQRGRRLFPYRELSPNGQYEFAVGTGKGGGRQDGQEIFFARLEDALVQALKHAKPLGVRSIESGSAPSKFLVFGAKVLEYEIAEELLTLAQGADRPPAAILPPSSTLALRAERFALRASRPEQSQFRARVFVAFRGTCAISECGVDSALDAAHKHCRDWRAGHNAVSDGWLLRKDLHALYDAELLKISTDGRVDLSADAATRLHYGSFHGKLARSPHSDA